MNADRPTRLASGSESIRRSNWLSIEICTARAGMWDLSLIIHDGSSHYRLRRRDDPAVDEGERRVDAEVRRGRVAFGVEELEEINVALRNAEGAGRGVEVDFRFCGWVQAAQIDGQ